MVEVDHGYDNFKGVMLCDRPADSRAGKASAGSMAGVSSPSQPFRSAVAESNEIGLPPTGESRTKISSLVARNRRIRRYTQNNAMTKHRRWLSRLGRTINVGKAADELNQIEADERRRKFKNFTTQLRKKILEGSSLDNIGWASLTRGQGLSDSREPTPGPLANEDEGEAVTKATATTVAGGEANDAALSLPSRLSSDTTGRLTKTLKKKDKDQVDLEMSLFLDDAVQDALDREKQYKKEEEEEDRMEKEALALRREESKKVGSSKKPGWALTEEQAEAREEDEEEELMSFVDNLDYDSYIDDYSKAEEDAIDNIVKRVDEETLEEEEAWKKEFVNKMNEAVNEEIMEKNLNSDDEDMVSQAPDDDKRSVRTGITKASRMSRMSRMSKKEKEEDRWDSSTVVGSNDRDKENVRGKMNLAAELLEEHDYLKQTHTTQSIKTILNSVKEEGEAAA